MLVVNIPIKTALEATRIEPINEENTYQKKDFYFITNIRIIKDELKKGNHTYCMNKKELKKIEELFPNVHCCHPVINDEKYDYMWEVWL